ncbi:MAG TPA: hypothetical protein VEZ14_00900 [Dehalococcoidia bacterium]|nr:hypothetical protein [Dehalococcoidia bacterium]
MHLLWRRYARSGYAPGWLYLLFAAGFAGLAAWGIVRGDWLVAAVAAAMLPVTLGGSRLMQRLRAASEASRRALDAGKENRHD